ncbi:MAG: ABC transporter ATP-binding protein, partial [Paraclostridium sp.]
MSRITNDVENISSGISSSIVQIITSILTIVGTFFMMVLLSPILTLVVCIIIPSVLGLSKIISNKTKLFFKQQQVELGILNSHIEESITNINIIKAFTYEEKSINKFNTINDKLLETSLKAQVYSSLLMPMMNVVSNMGFALISFIGAILSVKQIITVGTIVTFLTYMKQFTRPLNEIANLFNTLQSAVAGCERVFEVLDESVEIDNAQSMKSIEGNIVFENVCFAYNRNYILKDIRFEIKKGSSNAIIGSTGSGKTTIINLINRFYDSYKGKIIVDGQDINEYNKKEFRNCIGVVPQDIYIFDGTIIDNIKYSKLDATEEEVINACKLSNAHKFISNLKNGYYTQISENGQILSTGEKQLISIARAILKNPSILILDEATSSIDTNTEKKIQSAIKTMMKNRTSIIIAHRLSTIMDCDNIIVMDKGKIIERGSHSELMKLKGIYYTNICTLKGEIK